MTKQQQNDLILLCDLVKESASMVKAYAARGDETSAMREMMYLERTVNNVKKCMLNEDRIYEASIDFIHRRV